jgi:hypothetical protein
VRSSPERRRLRFSFQINNVKDPGPKPRTTFRRPIRLAPDVGGGGYLSNLEFRVKPFFSKPSEPIHQKQPKPFPANRGSSLKKTTNPVKQRFLRNLRRLEEDHLRILANPLDSLPEPRLLMKEEPGVNFEVY